MYPSAFYFWCWSFRLGLTFLFFGSEAEWALSSSLFAHVLMTRNVICILSAILWVILPTVRSTCINGKMKPYDACVRDRDLVVFRFSSYQPGYLKSRLSTKQTFSVTIIGRADSKRSPQPFKPSNVVKGVTRTQTQHKGIWRSQRLG